MSSIIKVDTIQNQSGANIISESSNTITVGASGDTITVPSGATLGGAGTVDLSSATVTLNANMKNTPAFQAYLSSDQTITELADVKIQFDTEFFDTDNCYDNSTNYRFTPTVAGKYLVYTSMRITASADSDMRNTLAMVYKNGSRINYFGTNYRNGNCRIAFCAGSMIVDMNGSSDYLEILAFADTVSGNNPVVVGGSTDHAIFGAYKIIE